MNTKDEPAEKNTQEKPEVQEDQVKDSNQEAADTNEEAPVVEAKEEAPAEEVKEEAPVVEAKEEAPAEEEKDPFSISLKNGSIQIQTHEVKLPEFSSGDTITIHYKIKEGSKERVQHFKGVVLQRKGTGTTEMVTVRKMSGGIGVERIIPLHSPFIEKLEVNKRGKVRRARIFYLRGLKGKSARIEEKRK